MYIINLLIIGNEKKELLEAMNSYGQETNKKSAAFGVESVSISCIFLEREERH